MQKKPNILRTGLKRKGKSVESVTLDYHITIPVPAHSASSILSSKLEYSDIVLVMVDISDNKGRWKAPQKVMSGTITELQEMIGEYIQTTGEDYAIGYMREEYEKQGIDPQSMKTISITNTNREIVSNFRKVVQKWRKECKDERKFIEEDQLRMGAIAGISALSLSEHITQEAKSNTEKEEEKKKNKGSAAWCVTPESTSLTPNTQEQKQEAKSNTEKEEEKKKNKGSAAWCV